MRISRTTIVLDAADLETESAFWAALVDGTVGVHDDYRSISAPGLQLGIQLVPDHQPPGWPDGVPQQLHLDLHVDALAPAHEQATALGARLLEAADDPDAERGHQVYADPAGHPFCLCWG